MCLSVCFSDGLVVFHQPVGDKERQRETKRDKLWGPTQPMGNQLWGPHMMLLYGFLCLTVCVPDSWFTTGWFSTGWFSTGWFSTGSNF